jgi:hypothetical protein
VISGITDVVVILILRLPVIKGGFVEDEVLGYGFPYCYEEVLIVMVGSIA